LLRPGTPLTRRLLVYFDSGAYTIQEFIKNLPRPPRQRITFEVAKSECVENDSLEIDAPETPTAARTSALGKKNAGTTVQSQDLEDSRRRKRPVRRNQKYEKIDDALQEIADSRPSTQEAAFQSLDDRRVVTPSAEPFMTARGWMAGFRRDEAAARAWLSKRWAELNLPPLPRGPKNWKK